MPRGPPPTRASAAKGKLKRDTPPAAAVDTNPIAPAPAASPTELAGRLKTAFGAAINNTASSELSDALTRMASASGRPDVPGGRAVFKDMLQLVRDFFPEDALRSYQEMWVAALKILFRLAREGSIHKILVLAAPCGSGKTIVARGALAFSRGSGPCRCLYVMADYNVSNVRDALAKLGLKGEDFVIVTTDALKKGEITKMRLDGAKIVCVTEGAFQTLLLESPTPTELAPAPPAPTVSEGGLPTRQSWCTADMVFGEPDIKTFFQTTTNDPRAVVCVDENVRALDNDVTAALRPTVGLRAGATFFFSCATPNEGAIANMLAGAGKGGQPIDTLDAARVGWLAPARSVMNNITVTVVQLPQKETLPAVPPTLTLCDGEDAADAQFMADDAVATANKGLTKKESSKKRKSRDAEPAADAASDAGAGPSTGTIPAPPSAPEIHYVVSNVLAAVGLGASSIFLFNKLKDAGYCLYVVRDFLAKHAGGRNVKVFMGTGHLTSAGRTSLRDRIRAVVDGGGTYIRIGITKSVGAGLDLPPAATVVVMDAVGSAADLTQAVRRARTEVADAALLTVVVKDGVDVKKLVDKYKRDVGEHVRLVEAAYDPSAGGEA